MLCAFLPGGSSVKLSCFTQICGYFTGKDLKQWNPLRICLLCFAWQICLAMSRLTVFELDSSLLSVLQKVIKVKSDCIALAVERK